MHNHQKKYLDILSKQYPTKRDAAMEIINLQAILSLPKATEHFLTDIHGEYEQFNHVLKNGSGSVRRKIEEVLGDSVSYQEKKQLATLIYYPQEKLEQIKMQELDISLWYIMTLNRLVKIVKKVSSKYTRSKVRKAIPDGFVYVIEEMITEKAEVSDKEAYYNEIIQTIVRVGQARAIMITLCELIQRLVVDHLHIGGDIFDRGPGAHIVMETICQYHSVDIQWGNHDLLWMGAAAGHKACIANVIRMAFNYGTLDVLEEGYGISLLPLAKYAMQKYEQVDCSCFKVNKTEEDQYTNSHEMEQKMYKAITIIQLKLEGKIIKDNFDFCMQDRLLLDKINYKDKMVLIDGRKYEIKDIDFPTVDKKNPYELTEEETVLMDKLKHAFLYSEKLQKHIKYLYEKGSLYKIYNGNLLFHGCIPMEKDGTFSIIKINGTEYFGKLLYDIFDLYVRKGYFGKEDSEERKMGQDLIWYLWNGPKSPTFGRSKMATFERIFVKDNDVGIEKKDPYYRWIEDDNAVSKMLEEFYNYQKGAHIINGHVPVRQKDGESPLRCNGRVLMIDGGFAKVYQKQTGIAGYTLVSNSRGLRLVSHEKFETAQKAVTEEKDIISDTCFVETFRRRLMVKDTDIGGKLTENIQDLEELLKAYQDGGVIG